MPGWGVIPTIRIPDMRSALAYYRDTLGFAVERGQKAYAQWRCTTWIARASTGSRQSRGTLGTCSMPKGSSAA